MRAAGAPKNDQYCEIHESQVTTSVLCTLSNQLTSEFRPELQVEYSIVPVYNSIFGNLKTGILQVTNV